MTLGPVEHLKIHIELVDIEANKKVNPVDLSGLWLTITRGKFQYKIHILH